jgi:AcrR family transcriptional regulator
MADANELREVSRRAVRARIGEVAARLFAEQGFDATTVDEIADAVGMSQRTFFRYFASKEDAALDDFARESDDFLHRLTARPADEPEWDSLRRVFDAVVERHADGELRRRSQLAHRLIKSSPTLLAAYLERADRLQQRLLEALLARAAENGEEADEAVLRAVIGAAFACLQATVSRAASAPEATDLGARLDAVMAAVRPARYA